MPKKKSASQPRRRQRAPSRTLSHAPTLFLAAAAVVALVALLLTSASTPAQHMQHLLHRAASPFKHARTPAFARIRNAFSLPPNAASHTTTTMSSSHTANTNENKNAAAAAADNTVDADSFHPGSSTNHNNNNEEPVLPLPAPGEEAAAEALKLDLGGDGVRLDALGPMVVNADGSLSRIANWDRMAEIERRNTLRVLGKRNRERLARLRGEGEGER